MKKDGLAAKTSSNLKNKKAILNTAGALVVLGISIYTLKRLSLGKRLYIMRDF